MLSIHTNIVVMLLFSCSVITVVGLLNEGIVSDILDKEVQSRICLSWDEACNILKICNFSVNIFELLTLRFPFGFCAQGAVILYIDLDSTPPELQILFQNVDVEQNGKCDCSACKDFCSSNPLNGVDINTTTAAKPSSGEGCSKPSSTPRSNNRSTMIPQPNFRGSNFYGSANTCLVLSPDNQCFLAKLCDLRALFFERGGIPPLCAEGSLNITSSLYLMNIPNSILSAKLNITSENQMTNGKECDCSTCNDRCTTNPLTGVR